MRLRALALVVIAAAALAACGNDTKGVVIERYDAINGVPQSLNNCAKTEWLLVVDQGDRVKPGDRFRRICVTFTEAVKYTIGSTYP